MPRSAATRRSSIRFERWWIAAGDEECPHCGALYAYEAEYRCPDCDGATCRHCVVLHQDRGVCPDCVPAGKKRTAKEGR